MKALCSLYAVTAALCSASGELEGLVGMAGYFALGSWGGMVAMVEGLLECCDMVYLTPQICSE